MHKKPGGHRQDSCPQMTQGISCKWCHAQYIKMREEEGMGDAQNVGACLPQVPMSRDEALLSQGLLNTCLPVGISESPYSSEHTFTLTASFKVRL